MRASKDTGYRFDAALRDGLSGAVRTDLEVAISMRSPFRPGPIAEA